MHHKLTLFIFLLFPIIVSAQKTIYRISLNSGLFSFAGKSAKNTSFINYSNLNNSGYTNSPYGSKAGLCYGLSANMIRATKTNFLMGLDIGYENLNSKVLIDAISGYTGNATYAYTATGKTILSYGFLNLYPFIGWRFKAEKLSFDITGGLELGYCLAANEKGNATATNGTKYITAVDRKTIKKDIRPRIQVSANYHKTGVYVGYSYGLTNYMNGYVGGINECYARLLRFGLTYQIK